MGVTFVRAYWESLNNRERLMLSVGVVCLVCYLLYAALYAPLTKAVHEKNNQLVEKQETLAWMKQAKTQYHGNHKTLTTVSSSKLLTILSKQLETSSFQRFPYHLQQVSAGDIQLVFEQVPYTPFMAWFKRLNETYAIVIKQFNAERVSPPGVVKLTLVIAAT